ncbi:MAG: SPFH domain-containing protein, partial [Treponema sp.]|nr:SPFH domain-containing protein [Treponema sp.]
TNELAEVLKTELSAKWKQNRGLEIQAVGVSSIKADEEDEKMIKDLQKNAAFMDPTRAAANLVGAQADAMKMAASNPNGSAMAFMGMGMANQAGGFGAQNLYAMGAQQNQANQNAQGGMQNNQVNNAAATGTWTCSCGTVNTGKFCSECGAKRPE